MADYRKNYNYKGIGGNITKVNDVIKHLEKVKNGWDEAVDSNESFYNEFYTKMDTLIKNLKAYKGFLEAKGKSLQKYAEWCD